MSDMHVEERVGPHYDKAKMLEAYNAQKKDRSRRMRAMRKTVDENDVSRWATSFLDQLSSAQPTHTKQTRPARRS